MPSVRLTVVLGLLMFAVACGSNYSSSTPSPSSPTPSPSPSSTPTATNGPTSAVTIPMGASVLGTQAFAPDDLDVGAGTTVTWRNTDSIAHTSTSDTGVWNSGSMAPGASFTATFTTAGSFTYHCSFHPGMVGTVTVQ
jgi:plastocyanin